MAAQSLDAGSFIVNDVSSCLFDPALRDVLVKNKPGYVLMQSLGKPGPMQNAPQDDYVVEYVFRFFEQEICALVRAGLPEDRIVLEPGIGFGTTLEHNLALIATLERFGALGRPLLMALSTQERVGEDAGFWSAGSRKSEPGRHGPFLVATVSHPPRPRCGADRTVIARGTRAG
ncbi:dihydropteroate synthase, partial [Oceanidesulfovibrio marinus]